MFDFLFGKKKPTKRRKVGSTKSRPNNNENKTLSEKQYSAVQIRCKPLVSCEEAQKQQSAVFLSNEAPSIPLKGCSQQDSCACRYLYLDDRRSNLRRDTDNGLPFRSAEVERRTRTERRKSVSA